MNDTGRYRQLRISEYLNSLRPIAYHCDSQSIVDRFFEVLLASNVPLRRFAPKHDQVETESARVRHGMRGTGGRNCDEDREVPDGLCRHAWHTA